jgi:hypothetical protein
MMTSSTFETMTSDAALAARLLTIAQTTNVRHLTGGVEPLTRTEAADVAEAARRLTVLADDHGERDALAVHQRFVLGGVVAAFGAWRHTGTRR